MTMGETIFVGGIGCLVAAVVSTVIFVIRGVYGKKRMQEYLKRKY